MSTISTITGATLTTMADQKILGTASSTSTQPTETAIVQWLNDAQYEIIRRIDPFLIPMLIQEYTPTTASAAVKTALPTNFFKLLSAYDTSSGATRPLKLIDMFTMATIKSGVLTNYTTTDYLVSLGNDGTNDVFFYYPSTDPAKKTFIIIIKPTTITTTGTETVSLADDLCPLLVDYAVIQSKMQAEELEQYMNYMNWWYKRVQDINIMALHREQII